MNFQWDSHVIFLHKDCGDVVEANGLKTYGMGDV